MNDKELFEVIKAREYVINEEQANQTVANLTVDEMANIESKLLGEL